MANQVAQITTDGDLKLTGNLNTRLPNVTNGLVAHFPFDGIDESSYIGNYHTLIQNYKTYGKTYYKLELLSAWTSGWHGINEIEGYISGAKQSLTGIRYSSATYLGYDYENGIAISGNTSYGADNAFDGAFSGASSGVQWLSPQDGTGGGDKDANYHTYDPFPKPEWITFSSTQPLEEVWVYNGRYGSGDTQDNYKDFRLYISYDGNNWLPVMKGQLRNLAWLDGENNKLKLFKAPLVNTNTSMTYEGIGIEESTTNLIPDKSRYPTYGNSHGTCNTNNYNSNVDYSIGTIGSVVDNIVTLSTVGRPIYTYDVLNAGSTGGGVTAGTEYFIKKHSVNSFSLHAYTSSQDGSNGYIVDGKGFKVHESIWSDTRVSISASGFPTMWHGNAHRPNSAIVKEVRPLGFKGLHDCLRLHKEYKTEGGTSDYMAYGVYPPVTVGETYTFSFWARAVTPATIGKYINMTMYTGTGWTGDGANPLYFNDFEWHKFEQTCIAPNTGGTNMYFAQPNGSTIDFAELQCEHKTFGTSFVNGSRSESGEFTISTIQNAPFTLAFKFNPNIKKSYSSKVNWVFTMNPYSNDFIMWKRTTEDYYRVRFSGLDFMFNSSDITQGQEHYIVITVSATTSKVYLNGEYKGSVAATTSIPSGIALGYTPNTSNSTVSNIYEDLSIYNKVLSDDEVKILCNKNFNLQTNGDLITSSIKSRPLLPIDATYFPLGCDANDEFKVIEPVTEENIDYEDGSVWVGKATTNVANNTIFTSWTNSGSQVALTDYIPRLSSTNPIRGIKITATGSIGARWCHANGNVAPNVKYSVSVYVWVDSSDTNLFYIREYRTSNTSGANVGNLKYNGVALGVKDLPQKQWVRLTYENITAAADITATSVCCYGATAGTIINATNVQIEQTAYCTPFANGTRNLGWLKYNQSLIANISSFTMGCWFKVPKIYTEITGNEGICGNWYNPILELKPTTNQGSRYGYGIVVSPDHTSFLKKIHLLGDDDIASSFQCENNTWYFLVGTYDGANYKVYIDGVEILNYASATPPSIHADTVMMVGGGYSGKQNSYIKDFFVKDSVLSDIEIENLYKEKMNISNSKLTIQNGINTGQNM